MILGISGGREGGNTDFLVKEALSICGDEGYGTEFLNLRTIDIGSCRDCGACQNGDCIQKDDMVEVLDLLEGSEAIIIGSPTYFANTSSHISLMMERSLPARRHGFKLRGKVGGAIAVGGSRNGGQENVVRNIQNWFTLHSMTVVADDAPTAHFGGIGTGRSKGDSAEDKTGLATSRNLGKRIAYELSLRK